jgi:hypothetical protein
VYIYLCMHLKCHQAYPTCHTKNRSEHSKKGSVLHFLSTALLNYDSQTSYFTVLKQTTYSSNNSVILTDCKSVAREQKNHRDLLRNMFLINILCGCVCICVNTCTCTGLCGEKALSYVVLFHGMFPRNIMIK